MRQEDGLFVKPPDDLKKNKTNNQVLGRNYSDSDIKRQHTFWELTLPSTSGGQDILCSHFWVRKWQKWEVQGQVGHGLSLLRKWHYAVTSVLWERSRFFSGSSHPFLAPFILDLGTGETSGKTGQLANRVEKTKREKQRLCHVMADPSHSARTAPELAKT